jgi:peptidylprolyl isomerase
MTKLIPVALAVLLLAGCGGDDEKKASSTTTAGTPAATTPPSDAGAGSGKISTDLKSEPTIGKPSGDPPAKLVTKDIVKGKGPKAKSGDLVSVQYTGVAFSTGAKFDASWDRGAEPFQFPLGGGQVITGWDKGVPGMRVGGRRELIIPPDQAYGPQGSPPAIGPNETLIFVVDLVKIG